MELLKPVPGALLYADPMLHDPHFGRSVVYLTSHDDQGSVGFIVNKKLEVTLNDIIPQPLPVDFDVYYGGPVGTDTLYFIHSLGPGVPDTVHTAHQVYWGGDFEYIAGLIESHQADEHNLKFFVGYSGWGQGQLIDELQAGSWVMGKDPASFVFDDTACMESWREKMNQLGNKFAVWANFPQNPSMN